MMSQSNFKLALIDKIKTATSINDIVAILVDSTECDVDPGRAFYREFDSALRIFRPDYYWDLIYRTRVGRMKRW